MINYLARVIVILNKIAIVYLYFLVVVVIGFESDLVALQIVLRLHDVVASNFTERHDIAV